MIEDDDNLADLERRMRTKLDAMRAMPTVEDAKEKAMVARLLGSKVVAEDFLRHESRKQAPSTSGRIDLRRPRTFKPAKPVIRVEYWERSIGAFPEWVIERYDNGKQVHRHTGTDWQKRDQLLIKLQAAGITCKPVTVAGVVPEPIHGRMRDQPKKPSAKAGIMAKIGNLTTDDLSQFHPDDITDFSSEDYT